MARPLLITKPQNATIEELKQLLGNLMQTYGLPTNPALRVIPVLENEEQLLERLGQAILDVINNPKKTQKIARIGTLI